MFESLQNKEDKCKCSSHLTFHINKQGRPSMKKNSTRCDFLKTTGVLSACTLLGASTVACGSSSTEIEMLSEAQQYELTATQVLAALKTKTMTAEAYVTNLIARGESLETLNAMITWNKEKAIAAAKKIDSDRAAGKPLGALAGLPIVVKDNINTSGIKTTGGTKALENVVPKSNAPSVQKLLDAGAIILGKTNMHELAFGVTSTNFYLGVDTDGTAKKPCKNPYNKTKIPGGSSGGTAVSIAARFAPAGLGTDTGGSSRVPAAMCGIAGFRPSVGDGQNKGRRYIDTNAVVPISHTRDTIGPMARTVEDIALLDGVITGTAAPAAIKLAGLRFGIPSSLWADLEPDVKNVAILAKQKLAAAGVVFVDIDTSDLLPLNDKISFQIALHEPIADIPAYLKETGYPEITLNDINAGISSPDVKGAFSAIIGDAFGAAYDNSINILRPQLQKVFKDYFSKNELDIIFFPTTPISATDINATKGSDKITLNDKSLDQFGTIIRNTDPGSNAGIPGLSIPAGLTSKGLPVGVEIDGLVGSDMKLLGIGMAIEKVLGFLIAPSV